MYHPGKFIRLPIPVKEAYKGERLLSELLVVSVGFRTGNNRLGYNVNKEGSDEYLVKYCIKGRGWFRVQDREYEITPGQLLLCPSNIAHSYGAFENDPWSVYWVYLSGRSVKFYFDLIDKDARYVINIGLDKNTESIFREILAIMENGYALQYAIHASDLARCLLSSCILKKINPSNDRNYTLEDVISHMKEHIDGQLSLDDMAGLMNVSRDYFIKLFRKKYGYSPMDYFLRMKMQKACELLMVTNMSIEDISDNLGYRDQFYFSRIFKSKIGLSPREYRKKNM